MKFEVATFGNPVLRVRASPVDRVTIELKRLVDDMLETMYGYNGLGLAAQQIGQTMAVCVIDVPVQLDVEGENGPRLNPGLAMPLVMINPTIVTPGRERERVDEGCLSFPGIHCSVQRVTHLTVAFTDLKGNRQTLQVHGLVARAVQHELDHLVGVLLVDRMSPVKKVSLAGQLKRLKAESREKLG